METKILSTSEADITIAAKIIKAGGLVAIPTETVYGLAADAYNADAVKRIFAAKGREPDNPLIVHISELSDLDEVVAQVNDTARALAKSFWPGPLTMIMKKSPRIPDEVTCNMDTVAVRLPAHPAARELIRRCGTPLAAPSANLSGGVSPVTANHCISDLSGRINAVIDGGRCTVGLESTVISMTNERVRILRPGFVTMEQLEAVAGPVEIDEAVLHPLKQGASPSSPGMKYKHYSPKAKVIIVDCGSDKYAEYVNNLSDDGVFALCFDEDAPRMKKPYLSYGGKTDSSTHAARLFDLLREFDSMGAATVYAHMPSRDGVGLAVYNRLLRAAAFEVIKL